MRYLWLYALLALVGCSSEPTAPGPPDPGPGPIRNITLVVEEGQSTWYADVGDSAGIAVNVGTLTSVTVPYDSRDSLAITLYGRGSNCELVGNQTCDRTYVRVYAPSAVVPHTIKIRQAGAPEYCVRIEAVGAATTAWPDSSGGDEQWTCP